MNWFWGFECLDFDLCKSMTCNWLEYDYCMFSDLYEALEWFLGVQLCRFKNLHNYAVPGARAERGILSHAEPEQAPGPGCVIFRTGGGASSRWAWHFKPRWVSALWAGLRCYFDDPSGQKLDICVRNLLLKFQGDPMVNESGTEILPKYV